MLNQDTPNPNKPTPEELQWLRSSPQSGTSFDDEIVESSIAKDLVERQPDGRLKLTASGFKYMIGGC